MMTESLSCTSGIQHAMTLPIMMNSSDKKKNHNHHRVQYNHKCSVVLIPSRQEYVDAGIDLWYSQMDQMNAQQEVLEEISTLLSSNPSLWTVKSAMRFLYEPRVDHYDNDDVDEGYADEASQIQKDPINVVIANQSMLQYKLHSIAITEVLSAHGYLVSSVTHYNTIEELISHRRPHDGGRESPCLYPCDAKTEEAPSVILLDQNVFCTYDLWSISMLIPSSIVTELRQCYHTDKVLIGLCIEQATGSNSLFLQSIEHLVDFKWMKPVDTTLCMESILPMLVKTRFKSNLKHNLLHKVVVQLDSIAYNDSLKLKTSMSEADDTDLSLSSPTDKDTTTTTSTCIKDHPTSTCIKEHPITSTAMQTYFKFLS